MGILTSPLRDDLASLRRRLAQAEGEQKALESRRETLAREVGLAKGRLALKPKADAFLEELQAEAHYKRVGDFERLLSALVGEVLPGEYPIGLNLEIERGQPSLEIVTRRGADRAEDIYDDQGGALTNVVSMGLRMIAAVRSRTRRFLVLDEPDCWIAPHRIPAFYKVMKDAAGKVGVQCFVISHHDVSTFEDGVALARISGNKDTGVIIENAPRPYRWKDDEEGLRFVRLRNFQSYVDETFHLTPGVNALTGPNNLGKSSFVRALRAVFYQGEARNSLIRHGEKSCTVEIGFAGGRVLHWNRQIRRNPINIWKLVGPDGSVVVENGMTYESGGPRPPDWVTDMFGIGPVEGLDVHIAKQKEPVFLLDKPGSTRAAVLSVGQESSHIRAMIALHKERCKQDADKVKEGEREMAVIVRRLESLERLTALKEGLDAASVLLGGIESRGADSDRITRCLAAIEQASGTSAQASARLEILSRLSVRAEVDGIASEAGRTDRMIAIANGMERAASTAARANRLESVLSGLPDAPPSLVRSDRLAELVQIMKDASSAAARGRTVEEALAGLPEAIPSIIRSDALIHAGRDIKRKVELAAAIALQGESLASLPAAIPELRDVSMIAAAVASISARDQDRARIASEGTRIDADAAACERELQELTEDMGHSCPICGGGIADPHVLVGHHHDHGKEHAHVEHA